MTWPQSQDGQSVFYQRNKFSPKRLLSDVLSTHLILIFWSIVEMNIENGEVSSCCLDDFFNLITFAYSHYTHCVHNKYSHSMDCRRCFQSNISNANRSYYFQTADFINCNIQINLNNFIPSSVKSSWIQMQSCVGLLLDVMLSVLYTSGHFIGAMFWSLIPRLTRLLHRSFNFTK